jgi:hypothetical protein
MKVNSHGRVARGLQAAWEFKRASDHPGAGPKACDRLLQMGP